MQVYPNLSKLEDYISTRYLQGRDCDVIDIDPENGIVIAAYYLRGELIFREFRLPKRRGQ